jgi:hypothetical protein
VHLLHQHQSNRKVKNIHAKAQSRKEIAKKALEVHPLRLLCVFASLREVFSVLSLLARWMVFKSFLKT